MEQQDRTLGELLHATASYLTDLIARIVDRIVGLVPVALLGCSGPKVEPVVQEKPAVSVEQAPVDKSDEPKELGKFDITFYYVIGEDEAARAAAQKAAKVANDNQEAGDAEAAQADLAAITAPQMVTIYESKSCVPIAEVTRDFAMQLQLQGTGKLRDGRVVNIWGSCGCERSPCFKVINSQWGTSGSGRPLQPFRTVAVDRNLVKLGSLLYVPLLEGRTMPGRPPWGGFVHDGCVVADDTGGGITGNQLDLFVGRKGYFLGLSGSRGSHAWARHVAVYDGSRVCERKGRKVGRKSASI